MAQQIGPILAEGSKGNPRQIKRFLNSLLIRRAIADAQGFGEAINQAVLAKLMLAERFQPDFYKELAGWVMVAENGAAAELEFLEETLTGKDSPEVSGKKKNGKKPTSDASLKETTAQWLE